MVAEREGQQLISHTNTSSVVVSGAGGASLTYGICLPYEQLVRECELYVSTTYNWPGVASLSRKDEKHVRSFSRFREREREENEGAYLVVIAVPPDGASAVDLAGSVQCQAVDAVEDQEVGWLSRPDAVRRYDPAIQLHVPSFLLFCCLYYTRRRDAGGVCLPVW